MYKLKKMVIDSSFNYFYNQRSASEKTENIFSDLKMTVKFSLVRAECKEA